MPSQSATWQRPCVTCIAAFPAVGPAVLVGWGWPSTSPTLRAASGASVTPGSPKRAVPLQQSSNSQARRWRPCRAHRDCPSKILIEDRRQRYGDVCPGRLPTLLPDIVAGHRGTPVHNDVDEVHRGIPRQDDVDVVGVGVADLADGPIGRHRVIEGVRRCARCTRAVPGPDRAELGIKRRPQVGDDP